MAIVLSLHMTHCGPETIAHETLETVNGGFWRSLFYGPGHGLSPPATTRWQRMQRAFDLGNPQWFAVN